MAYYLIFLLSLISFLPQASAKEVVGAYSADEQEVLTPPPVPRRGHPKSCGRAPAMINACNDQLQIVGNEADPDSRNTPTCDLTLDPYFVKMMQQKVPFCARRAASQLHRTLPVSVKIHQMGAFSSRLINVPDKDGKSSKGGSCSRHSEGQALDIAAISLDYGDGNTSQKINLTENSNDQEFYTAFRDCWNRPDPPPPHANSDCRCSIGHPHMHPPSNELHKDHMHMSVVCPKLPGVASC